MRPVWLCPLRLRADAATAWPTLPADRRARPTSTSASGAPSTSAPTRRDAPRNRAIEAKVAELGGHKRLYSEAFYDRDDLRPRSTTAPTWPRVKARYDPDDRLTTPLRQGGATTMTQLDRDLTIGDAVDSPAARTACRCASRRTTAAAPGPPDAAHRPATWQPSAAWPTC